MGQKRKKKDNVKKHGKHKEISRMNLVKKREHEGKTKPLIECPFEGSKKINIENLTERIEVEIEIQEAREKKKP